MLHSLRRRSIQTRYIIHPKLLKNTRNLVITRAVPFVIQPDSLVQTIFFCDLAQIFCFFGSEAIGFGGGGDRLAEDGVIDHASLQVAEAGFGGI